MKMNCKCFLKYLFIITVFCFGFIHEITAQKSQKHDYITVGVKDSIYSKILKENREVWVHVPNSEDGELFFQKKKYPVVYLLDGDAHFYSVTGMIRQLSTVNGNEICPEMIVVGILNTNRIKDLTPTKMKGRENSGGGEAFTSFLEKELIPYIDSKYPTRPYRTLIGHSFGGLTVVNTLINHSHLFANYVAIDPSLSWDNQKLHKQAAEVLKTKKFKNKSLYLSVANDYERTLNANTIMTDTTYMASIIRAPLEFKNTIKANPQSELNLAWKFYENDNHGSVPLISEYDALHFLFSWYEIKGLIKLLESKDPVTAADFINHINNHYKIVSDHFGYTVPPKEELINILGYNFMRNKEYDKAYVMFDLNIKNYPENSNVYDSMGDYYEAQSNISKAIEYYKKAYKIGKKPMTKEKLEKLKNN